MAGFNKKGKDIGTNQVNKKKSKKEFKVTPVEKKDSYEELPTVGKDVELPRFFPEPSSRNKIDLFIVHALGYQYPKEFIPYFIGRRTINDYSEIISNSMPDAEPSDIIDREVNITNLNKRGGSRR